MKKKNELKIFVFGLMLLGISACAPVGEQARYLASDQENLDNGQELVDPPEEKSPRDGLAICSKLNFEGIEWSETLPVIERDPFALALNVTGSFEGNRGFENLTGNFDGQGISMGLLQQNLGQGSLQPLLIAYRDYDLTQFSAFFSAAHSKSLLAMLKKWESRAVIAAKTLLEDNDLSTLDDPALVAEELGLDIHGTDLSFKVLLSRNQESVNWAKANALSGTKIKSDWNAQLKTLAGSGHYRSLQVGRAEVLHNRALALFDFFRLREVRSYLFFFDIIIQNGGIPAKMRSDLKKALDAQPNLSETQKLKMILEKRLTLVKAQWRADVRRRKTALINGKGVVHGTTRDFEREYCAKVFEALP